MDLARMTTRTTKRKVTFIHPFLLKGVDRTLPAGDYQVITDEELIEGLSFPVYRRVSTMMYIPAQSPHSASSVEMVAIDPFALQAARDRDAEATKQLEGKPG
jgi:hypothetical protein